MDLRFPGDQRSGRRRAFDCDDRRPDRRGVLVLLFSRGIDTDATCPGRLSGQSHNDSLPVSGALWTLQEAWGEELTPVLLDALTALPQDVGYEEFAEAMASVVGMSLGADAEATARAAFDAKGLFHCERTVLLEPGAGIRFLFLDSDLGLSPYTPPPLQFAIDVPAGTARVELDYLSVDELFTMPTAAHAAWRWGGPGLFEYGGPSGGGITNTFDDGASDLPIGGTLDFEAVLSDESMRLHLAVVNPDNGRHWVGVENLRFVEASCLRLLGPAPDEGEAGPMRRLSDSGAGGLRRTASVRERGSRARGWNASGPVIA